VTVKELQGELKARGLDTKGKKAELEARLAEAKGQEEREKEQPAAVAEGAEEPAEGGEDAEQQPQNDEAGAAAQPAVAGTAGADTEGDEGQQQQQAADDLPGPAVADGADGGQAENPSPGGAAPAAADAGAPAPSAPPAGAAGAAVVPECAQGDAAAPADPELVAVIDKMGTLSWPSPPLEGCGALTPCGLVAWLTLACSGCAQRLSWRSRAASSRRSCVSVPPPSTSACTQPQPHTPRATSGGAEHNEISSRSLPAMDGRRVEGAREPEV
jgi:hypothetical protein